MRYLILSIFLFELLSCSDNSNTSVPIDYYYGALVSNGENIFYKERKPSQQLITDTLFCFEKKSVHYNDIDYTQWEYTDYKNGDYIEGHVKSVYDNTIFGEVSNSITVTNNNPENLDAVIVVLRVGEPSVYDRLCKVYLENGKSIRIDKILVGKYKLRVQLGNTWKEIIMDGYRYGSFSENIINTHYPINEVYYNITESTNIDITIKNVIFSENKEKTLHDPIIDDDTIIDKDGEFISSHEYRNLIDSQLYKITASTVVANVYKCISISSI